MLITFPDRSTTAMVWPSATGPISSKRIQKFRPVKKPTMKHYASTTVETKKKEACRGLYRLLLLSGD